MSAQITIGDLAVELGVHPNEVSRQVSALCRDAEWGSKRVVALAVSSNRRCELFPEAADEIRALLTRSAA